MFGWFKKEPEKEVPQIKGTHFVFGFGPCDVTGRYYTSNCYTTPTDIKPVPEKYTVTVREVKYVTYNTTYTAWVDEESMREIKGETE